MLMEELLFAKRVQKGKPLITEEVIDCVHRYARETEKIRSAAFAALLGRV